MRSCLWPYVSLSGWVLPVEVSPCACLRATIWPSGQLSLKYVCHDHTLAESVNRLSINELVDCFISISSLVSYMQHSTDNDIYWPEMDFLVSETADITLYTILSLALIWQFSLLVKGLSSFHNGSLNISHFSFSKMHFECTQQIMHKENT